MALGQQYYVFISLKDAKRKRKLDSYSHASEVASFSGFESLGTRLHLRKVRPSRIDSTNNV